MSLNLSTFPLGPFVISVGGIFLLIGFIISSFFLIRTTSKRELSVSFLSDNLLIFLLVPVLLGRIGTFIKQLSSFGTRLDCSQYNSLPDCLSEIGIFEKLFAYIKYFFMVWDGGLEPIWIVVGFLAIFILMSLIKREPLMRWLDAFVSPSIIFVIFIHIGGFFSAWSYGRPVSENFPLAISYDLQSVRYSGPIHPVQVYGAILFGILFFVGLKICQKSLKKRPRWRDGTFFGIMTFIAALINGFLEFFRGDAVNMIFDTIRLPQVISFVLAFLALIFLVFHTHEKYDMPKIEPDPDSNKF